MGAILKKFGKKTATHMEKQAARHKAWTKMGLKGPKYKIGKKVKGSHHLDEVWTYDKNYKEKAEGGRIGFKRAGPVTKADLAKRDLWTKRELKRRSKIGQRKSRWDIKGGISGHPLNPLRLHAAGKATDITKMYKDTYGRTRDELKKSRDPNVKRVAENFQKMDYLDKSRSDSRYQKGTSKWGKDYAPKLTKRVHVGRKTGGKA